MTPSETVLEVRDLRVRFGGVTAVDGVDLTVNQGEQVGLLGQNGAGKTTILNCVSRTARGYEGSVSVHGQDIRKLRPWQVRDLGIARTYQAAAVFANLSALEMVLLGSHAANRTWNLSYFTGMPRALRAEQRLRGRALEQLDTVGFRADPRTLLRDLPYGQAKLVDLARALMMEPQTLLLDEPASGLGREEKQAFARLIRRVCSERSLTLLMIEHDMDLIRETTDRVVVVEGGRVICRDEVDAALRDERVVASLLG